MYANTPSPYVSDTIETKPFHSANQFNLIKSNRIELKSDKKEICFSSSFTLITGMLLPFAYPFTFFPIFLVSNARLIIIVTTDTTNTTITATFIITGILIKMWLRVWPLLGAIRLFFYFHKTLKFQCWIESIFLSNESKNLFKKNKRRKH